ncbi:hypothetical protein BSLG_000978 [Batrachochytrium salamandrivorans]|nr:hypothetical protein BSLG_000978 [Batrachochytrium salamandrivorans]
MLRAALLTSSKYSSPLLHYCLNNHHSHSLLASGLPHRCFVCSSAATPLNSTPTVIRRTALPTTTGSILMATDSIPNVPASISFPGEEEKILSFWKDIDAFKTSLKLSEGRPPFSFYDGPPFATGLPHYGHLLAGTIKDVVTRFAHLNGHYVERPADVAAMGIAKYNAECRAIVMTYANEWEATVTRMGRWIDFENDYKTLNITFMESVWWVFKQLFDKGQVYRGFKIMPYSMAVCTPLSNFEANQNYKDVVDPAIVISFPLTSDPKVSFLAWTTTPWTLPTNLALCVHPDFEYIQIHDEETGADWILLEKRLDILYKDPKKAKFTIVRKYKGSELKGMTYVPLFDYFSDRPGKSFVVLNDTYVTDDSGTGIVHSAPAFGEDDYRICLASGVVTGEAIYPAHLMLLETSLIRAVPSWYVRVSNIVDKLIKNNSESHWVPDYVGEKRFHNWLAAAHDWGISRSRYWGTQFLYG